MGPNPFNCYPYKRKYAHPDLWDDCTNESEDHVNKKVTIYKTKSPQSKQIC